MQGSYDFFELNISQRSLHFSAGVSTFIEMGVTAEVRQQERLLHHDLLSESNTNTPHTVTDTVTVHISFRLLPTPLL